MDGWRRTGRTRRVRTNPNSHGSVYEFECLEFECLKCGYVALARPVDFMLEMAGFRTADVTFQYAEGTFETRHDCGEHVVRTVMES